MTRFKLKAFANTPTWGGFTYTGMWTHKSHLAALADFFQPENFDPDATIMVAFAYGPWGFGISNIMNYAKPVKKPAIYKKFNAIWPKLINTQRMANLTDFVEEQRDLQPLDKR